LALEDEVITFFKAYKHTIHATIAKFNCPDNPNHVMQSMSFQLQDESHSPLLPALPFLAIPYLSNTSTTSLADNI
jgi:uncharacterized protein YccT (UPF0319 family)